MTKIIFNPLTGKFDYVVNKLTELSSRNHNDLQNLNPAGGSHTLDVGINTKIINVADYGTDGAAIQAAINALPVTGGMIFIPEGTYLVDAPLTVPYANTSIVGSGKSTILKSITPAIYEMFNIDSKENLQFRDLHIEGSIDGLYFKACHNSKVMNCSFYNIGDVAINDKIASNNLSIFNCIFDTVGYYGIQLRGSDCRIQGNYFTLIEVDCIITENVSERTIITNNNFILFSGYGIDIGGDFSVVSGNNINYCGLGILISSDHSIITNNQINYSEWDGIGVASTNGCVINNNIITNSVRHGIYAIHDTHNTISGNEIIDNDSGDTDSFDGIFLIDCDRLLISNNICRSTTGTTKQRYGININSGIKNKIISNILYQNKTGAINDAGTDTEIDHNQTV